MTRLDLKLASISLSLFSGVLYVGCGIFTLLFPEQTIAFANLFIHAIDLDLIAVPPLITPSRFIIGLIASLASGLILGALFAGIYNYLAEKFENESSHA